jgi:cell division protein FtsB
VNAASWLAAAALIVSPLCALFGKRGETRVTDDANLRDDQREFITTLRQDNNELRERVALLEREDGQKSKRLRAQAHRIGVLEAALREAGIPVSDHT